MGTTDGAAARFAELHQFFRERPVTGPEGHCVVPSGSRPTAVNPGLPFDATVIEHIDASIAEVVQLTRSVNPDAGPPPARVQDVYAWCHEHTQHAPQVQQLRRETVEYRHYLEHAVHAGDDKVIRPHRCPECRTFGLMWDKVRRTVVCTNSECVTREGLTRTFTFARLAYAHVTAAKNVQQARAT